MRRYNIFLKIGKTVEVEAEALEFVHDVKGNIFRLDFVNYDLNTTRVVAMFYAEDLLSWVQLPESEEEMSNEKAITNLNLIRVAFVKAETKEQIKLINDTIDKAIEALKPKTGHWIGHREHCENLGVMPSGLGDYEWCSNCDCGIDVMEWHRNNYHYCPNCGAKMIEP